MLNDTLLGDVGKSDTGMVPFEQSRDGRMQSGQGPLVETRKSQKAKPNGKLTDPNQAIMADQLPRAGGSEDRLITC